ncbi:hypothetical protein AMC83_PA00090 (plasmid) [Rhizobium phaseoli]|uniref:hypothetical protein n=1 Tax=Rhizobium phaseoli TaxID=396 RepID=UPI0007E93940|nr:hypothetical protein [Rhizobium phaseoli]ANL74317.1 hypothetical protein AMC83_PA00090 [Rhizobium phaseoli]
MQHIAIETAKFCDVHGFKYESFSRFPSTPKGLALAVVAADRMMTIDAYQVAHSDINVKFYLDEFDRGQQLDDDRLFFLISRHKAGFPIITDCRVVFEEREITRKQTMQAVIIAAVEDLIAAGFTLTVGSDDFDGEPTREIGVVLAQLRGVVKGADFHVEAYRSDEDRGMFTVEDDGTDDPIGSYMTAIAPYLTRAKRIAIAA